MSVSFRAVGWAATTNIYEVNLRQYTPEGTIAAFARHLPRLKDMGIETLWFMPIQPISVDGRLGSLGSYYACADYTAINPEFGSLEDLIRLVKQAHEMGLKVIIDIVANHTGRDHRWTREHPDFYRRNHEGQFFDAHGWADVIDLNYDNPVLRQAMIDVMRFWIEQADVDGFRCDMAMLVPLEFWKEARTALDPLKELFWLAECEEIDYHEVFDASYTWKFLHGMEAFRRKEFPISGLDEILQYYDSMFPVDAIRAWFTSNHDENSHSGSEYERLGEAAKVFAVFSCTWNGVPLIYSGQELPNYKRLKFFDKDNIEWGDAGKDAAGWAASCQLHSFYKALLELRKRNPALRTGDPAIRTYRLYTGMDDRLFAFLRKAMEDEVLVLLNLSGEAVTIAAGALMIRGDYYDVLADNIIDFSIPGKMDLGPWGYKVLERKKG